MVTWYTITHTVTAFASVKEGPTGGFMTNDLASTFRLELFLKVPTIKLALQWEFYSNNVHTN